MLEPGPSTTIAAVPVVGDPLQNDRRRFRWACCGTVVLTLASIIESLINCYSPIDALRPLHTEWVTLLAVAQGLGLLALLWCFGRPTTLRSTASLIILNGCLLALMPLHSEGVLDVVTAMCLDLLLHVTVLVVWSIVVLGFPYVAIWIWQRRRSPRSTFQFGRWWFAALMLVVTAEPLVGLLERSQDVIRFPTQLPDPPDGELRIVSIGSSTMFGSPYDPKFGIPQVVAWRVQQMYPRHRVVSENLALPGLSLRQAIDRLHKLKYRPHLLLVYGGHNEFFHDVEELGSIESYFGALDGLLSWSPTFRVLNIRVRQDKVLRSMKSGNTSGLVSFPLSVPEVLERRRLRFQRQLEHLARFGQTAGVPMLWYVPAASESGYEPNRSVVARGTSDSEIATLNEISTQALDRERAADWTAAALLYRTGLQRQPQFAEFHFRLGHCLLKLGLHDEARGHFQKALDNDGHPVRLTRPYRQTITDVGTAFSIPVVYTGEALRPHAEFGILDRSLFHDNVHPTLRGFYLMGMAAVDRLANSRLLELRFGSPAGIHPAHFEDAIKKFGMDRKDIARALRVTANGLNWLARLRFYSEHREQQAAACLRLAERLDQGDIQPGDEQTEPLP